MLPVLAPLHKCDPETGAQCRWNPWTLPGISKNVKGEENYNSVSGVVSGGIMDNNWSTKGRNEGMICAPSVFCLTSSRSLCQHEQEQPGDCCKPHPLKKSFNRKIGGDGEALPIMSLSTSQHILEEFWIICNNRAFSKIPYSRNTGISVILECKGNSLPHILKYKKLLFNCQIPIFHKLNYLRILDAWLFS